MQPISFGRIVTAIPQLNNPPQSSKTFARYESKTGGLVGRERLSIEGIEVTSVTRSIESNLREPLKICDPVTESMANDPLIRHVLDDWGFDAAGMKFYVLMLGIERVVDEIRRVRRMHWLRSRGAYLNRCLDSKVCPRMRAEYRDACAKRSAMLD